MRFDDDVQMQQFVGQLAAEVSSRLAAVHVKARCVQVLLYAIKKWNRFYTIKKNGRQALGGRSLCVA